MGVVVYKTSLATGKKPPHTNFIDFKLCDLKRYKLELISMIKTGSYGRASDQSRVPGYKLMNFNQDRYKTNSFILFNQAARDFSEQARYGDVVLIKEPALMNNSKDYEFKMTVNHPSKIMIIGQSKDYGTCSEQGCNQFLNINKHLKCVLHTEKENDLTFQNIKASRPYLRGNTIDANKVMRQDKMEKDIESNYTCRGFRKVEENHHTVNKSAKKKMEKQILFEKNQFNEYLVNRTRQKTGITMLDNVKSREREYITQQHQPMLVNERKKKMNIDLDDDQEVNIDHYKDLLGLKNKKKEDETETK